MMKYEKPTLQYWNAAQLNDIEATMSGGGGYLPAMGSIYLLNNVDGLITVGEYGLLGHAAILIQKPDTPECTLFNFSPVDNHSGFLDGAVAHCSLGDMTFSAFAGHCRNGGVLVNNGSIEWTEGFDRYIKIHTYQSVCDTLRTRALSRASGSLFYNVLSYNCLSFVIDILSASNIKIYDSSGNDLSTSLIPNSFFNQAASSSKGTFYAATYF